MSKKNIHVYPAIFDPCEEGGYTVSYPDLEGCITEGDTLSDALYYAKESLELFLFSLEEDGDVIPEPSAPEAVEVPKGAFISLIEVYMPPVRDEMYSKSVNKNVTLPYWLKKMAEDKKINFSQVLQFALKEKLGIKDRRG